MMPKRQANRALKSYKRLMAQERTNEKLSHLTLSNYPLFHNPYLPHHRNEFDVLGCGSDCHEVCNIIPERKKGGLT